MSRSKKIRISALVISITLLLSMLCAPMSAAALYDLPAGTAVSASSALLISLGSQQDEDVVLYDKDADAERSPAALVNLMVGATALKLIREKNINMDTTTGMYTKELDDKYVTGTGLNTASMAYGKETWTVRDLLCASMIQTIADASVTLAATLGGSVEQFVADMNALAAEIGCTDTKFANVTGDDSIFQYTTARDLYRIMRYAMDDPEYEALFSTTQYTSNPVSGGVQWTWTTTNLMLRPTSNYYYSPMVFGKTGITDAAGCCLASVARDSGYEYLCVVMGSTYTTDKNNHFIDTKTLYKWAFNNFTYKELLSENEPVAQMTVNLAWEKDKVTLVPEKGFATTVANDLTTTTVRRQVTLFSDSADAPITKGQVYGKVELYIGVDQKIGEVNLVASESIDRSEVLSIWQKVQEFLSSPWFYGGLILLVLLLIGYVILNIVHNQKRKRLRMKRVKKY